MRVLQLISSAGYYGAENMLVTLADELTRAGCATTVGAFQTGAEPEILLRARERNLATQAFACHGRVDISLPGRLSEFLRNERIDVLHTHGYKANLYGRFTGHSAAQLATCHNWAVRTGSLGFYSVLDRLALRRVPAVVAVSDGVAARLAEFGMRAPRVRVIPNGVDLRRFSQAAPALRHELNLDRCRVIGTVTRLTPRKGLDILLDAFLAIASLQPGVALVVVGAGPLDAELKAQVSALGLTGRVYFTGARSDMPEVYASFDVFVLPSLDEGMPMSVLEAISSGIPVVATSVGAIPELAGGAKGWLVAPGEAQPLASALGEALQNRQEAQQRAGRAREHVEAHYSAQAMARAYLELYESLLPGAR